MVTKSATKPKLKNQDEADVVEYLRDTGHIPNSVISPKYVFPDYVVGAARHTRTLLALISRFDLQQPDDKYSDLVVLNQALFDACDEWVQEHQED